jgi:hypothetical protein
MLLIEAFAVSAEYRRRHPEECEHALLQQSCPCRDVIVLIASASQNEPAPSLASPDLALLLQEAAEKPFDLLSLMAGAMRVCPMPGTLIVVSSGLSTAGGLDFRQFSRDADLAAVAAQLKQRGLLPDLAKWRVTFSGLADTAGDQVPLPLPQQTELTGYWLAICQAAGAASCETDDVTRPDLPSLSSTVVPVVPIPPVIAVQGPHHWAGKSISDAAFFAFDSSQLLPGANAILGPLADTAVDLTPEGIGNGIRLSRRRFGHLQRRAFPGARGVHPGTARGPRRVGQPDRQRHRRGDSRSQRCLLLPRCAARRGYLRPATPFRDPVQPAHGIPSRRQLEEKSP